MRLDQKAAENSLRERLAEPLDVTLERAASGMLQVATSAMANAVRHVTLERGLDPRDFTLVAYGGGGPLHAASVAQELSIGTVIIPQAPGHFSALGMLMADLRRDYVQTLFERLDDLEMDELEEEFRKLEAEGRRGAGALGDRRRQDRLRARRGYALRRTGTCRGGAHARHRQRMKARALRSSGSSTKPMTCATATARRTKPPIS